MSCMQQVFYSKINQRLLNCIMNVRLVSEAVQLHQRDTTRWTPIVILSPVKVEGLRVWLWCRGTSQVETLCFCFFFALLLPLYSGQQQASAYLGLACPADPLHSSPRSVSTKCGSSSPHRPQRLARFDLGPSNGRHRPKITVNPGQVANEVVSALYCSSDNYEGLGW